MKYKTLLMPKIKNIAIIAHDNCKDILMEWAEYNRESLRKHNLYATGTTGKLLEENLHMDVTRFMSGPLGGDVQISSKIAEGKIDFLIFFWDPLSPLPHDPDIKALLRLAVLWNIPTACNRASADFIITSAMFDREYEKIVSDFTDYVQRFDT